MDVSSSFGGVRDSRALEKGFSAIVGTATGINQSSSILSAGSTGTSESSMTEYSNTSLMTTFEETVTSLFTGLRERSCIRTTNWYSFIFSLVFIVYSFWAMMFLPALDHVGMNWETNSAWVFKAANYPVTLALNLSSIETVTGILIGFFVIITTCVVMLVASLYAINTTNKHWPKIKLFTRVLMGFLTFTSLFYSYAYSLILGCNYGHFELLPNADQPLEILKDFTQVACVSSLNSAMMAVGGFYFLVLMVIVVISSMTLFDNNPTCKNLFVSETNMVYLPLTLFHCLYIILSALLPSRYAFIAPCVYCCLSLCYLAYVVYLIPFFRKIENTIYFGINCARVGFALGFLISSIVNNVAGISESVKIGMLGIVFGLAVIFLCVGLIGMELYLRYIAKTVRRLLTETCVVRGDNDNAIVNLERDASYLYQIIEGQGRQRQLMLFFKLSKSYPSDNSDRFSDLELSLKFIKGLFSQRVISKMNYGCLLTASIIVAYFNPNIVLSISVSTTLLRRAAKFKNNFIRRFLVNDKTKECEFLYGKDSSGKNHMELKNILAKLDKKQLIIHYLHKAFWKELMNENVDIEKVQVINRQISRLTNAAQSSFDSLMQSYNHDKSVIRAYAKFLEECQFNADLAAELFQEATAIEDDEASSQRKLVQKKNNHNKVVPASSSMLMEADTRASNQDGYFDEKSEQDLYNDIENDKFDGVENTESSARKVDALFRMSLNMDMKNQLQLTSFIVFATISVIILTVGLVMSIVISFNVSGDIYLSKSICMPAAVPLGLTRRIREKQVHMTLLPDDPQWQSNHDQKLKQFFATLRSLKDLSLKDEFSSAVRSDYVKQTRKYRQPMLIYSGSSPSSWQNYTIDRNTSIADITESLLTNCETILSYTNEKYNHTADNINFMYLYLNRINFSAGFETFCNEYLVRNGEKAETFRDNFLAYYAASTGAYVVCAVIIILATNYFLSSLTDAVKLLDKRVSKDKVGKIYHALNTKLNDDMQIGNDGLIAKLLRPNILIAILVVLVILVTVGCVSLFFLETLLNSNFSANAIRNIQSSVNVIMTSQRIGLRLQEIFVYNMEEIDSRLPLKNPTLTSRKELQFFHEDHKNLIDLVNTKWYGLLYGNNENGYSKLIGQYPKIDNIINGIYSCNATLNSTQCPTMSQLISNITNSATLFNEDIFYNPSQYRALDVFKWTQSLFRSIDNLGDLLQFFIETYSKYAANPSVAITITFAIVGYILLVALISLTYTSMSSFWAEYRQFRMMLNFFPSDLLEDDVLKKFILHKELPPKFKRKDTKNSYSEGSNTDNIKALMNASVDGSILCNEKGEINLFNPVAESCFGLKSSDVVGLSVYTLFSESSHATIKKILAILTDRSKTSKGESVEVECLRKNNTTFPARANMFASKSTLVFVIRDITAEKKQNSLLEEEKKKSDSLLRNILPEAVGQKLKLGQTFIAEKHNDVTCFFSDMVNFTALSSTMDATGLVKMLNTIVNGFDALTDVYHLEKIKTIGDAYFCVGGIHTSSTSDHPERVLRFAIETFNVVYDYNLKSLQNTESDNDSSFLNIRCGINTGAVIAGVIGTKKFAYDMWGDTINVASRMESTSKSGRIQCSRSTYERVYDLGLEFEERRVEVKGKGSCQTYLLNDKHHKNPIPSTTPNIPVLE
ncbi:hypothetical protein C9374_008680 [Naegleria lovaniensis]|uniref:Adenylate and Guanylate cyclase catalytic domain containing protein n=1 Tax=Naegleria lovaniensis TaxID=51637 RepID=A0AA88KHQ0_NAELO|nr:uncharacterized protein C9374_008680 [Naegleria lovaniensis]KAG2378058.1 hypothetical protein C9374_008680 [Naegleria lovaniensis]